MGDQVGQLLVVENLLKPLRHQRTAQTGERLDVRPQDLPLLPVQVHQRDAVGPLVGDHAGELGAVLRGERVHTEPVLDRLIGIEDGR